MHTIIPRYQLKAILLANSVNVTVVTGASEALLTTDTQNVTFFSITIKFGISLLLIWQPVVVKH